MATFSSQQLVIGNSPVGFTFGPPNIGPLKMPFYASFVLENAPIRVLTSGEDPTNTYGVPIDEGQFVELKTETDIENFRAIVQDPTTTATLTVQFANAKGED